ncbi:hypothetical protein BSKO_03399 [Bryopsis sp. KO-2023]|nr:hypothetical protein BSKO_03399 [Bryopsis sp. KO-2023]
MSTTMDVVCLELLSRSLGPACSNVTHFVLEERTRLYRAYGVSGGTVIVQAVQIRGTSHKEEPIETIVVIGPSLASNPKADDVELVEWGGGQHKLIAIATAESISVCSLSLDLDGQKKKSGQGPTAGFHYLATWETESQPISLSWTQDASGLVILEDTGRVSCALIKAKEKTSEGSAADPLAKTSGRVLDKTSLRAQEDSMYADVEGMWSGVAQFKQSILSAGPCPGDPVATAAAGLSNFVIVWWPDSSGGARQERLRHPCAVLGLDWSEPTRDAPTSVLLSVCQDGVVRIWGKLDLDAHDVLGKEVSTPKHLPVFCLMLVVEPPFPAMPPEQGSQAVWVKPPKGKTPGSNLLWFMSAHHDNAASKDLQISLWGIDAAQNGASGVCQGPRAIPWGSTSVAGRLLDVSRLAAFMVFPEPGLEMMLVESTWDTCGTSAESQVSLLHCGSSQLSKAVHRNFVIDGPLSSVESLVVHPSLDLICTINVELCAAIWDMWPVHCLAHIHPASVSMQQGIQSCQWVEKSLLSRDFLGFLLLAGSDGAVLCSVTLDVSRLTNDSAEIDIIASVPLPEGLKSVTKIVPISGRTPGNEQFWFMLWDSGRSTAGHLLHLQSQDDQGWSMSFPHAQIPLTTGNAALTTMGNCLHHPIILSGDSKGSVWAQEIDLEKGGITMSAECKLGTSREVVGVIQSLAACRHAPYVICTTELGPEGQEDTVWVLQSESTGDILKHGVDARIELPSTSADVAWVHGCSMVMAFVVCYESGDAQVWVRSRTGSWEAAAQFSVGIPISCMGSTSHGLPVVAAGKHLLVLSCSSDAIHRRYFLGDSIAGCNLVAGGTLSDYHPDHIRILAQVGFLSTAHSIGNSLVEWLRQAATGDARVALTVLGPGAALQDLVGEDIIPTKIKWPEPSDLGNHVPFSPLAAYGVNMSDRPARITAKASDSVVKSSAMNSAGATGLLDMSAFGQNTGGNAAPGTGTHSTVESGMLDMGAFGMDTSPPSEPPKPPSTVESGMLDMGAFGMDAPPPPMPPKAPSAVESGMLDMGAFGMDAPPPPMPPKAPSAVESGMLDMGAFGMDAPPPPMPPKAPSAVESGMLDMGAFGMDAPPPPMPPKAPSAVESGMLDMGAFGMDAPPPPVPPKPPSAVESGMLDMGAFGLDTPPPPAPTQRSLGLESGMLDMAAFGLDTSPPQPPQPAVVSSGVVGTSALDAGRSREGGPSTPEAISQNVEGETEQCFPLKATSMSPSGSSRNDHRLPKDMADFLLSFVPDESCQSTESVQKTASLLGLTESELLDVCGIIGKQGSSTPDSASRLDFAGKKAFMGVRLASAPIPDTNNTNDAPTESPMPFPGGMGMSRPISYQSLPSAGASFSTIFEAEGAGDTSSWSRKVGLNPGINSCDLLWAAQSETQSDLITCCMEATKKQETASGSSSQTAADFMIVKSAPQKSDPGKVSSWEELKAFGAGFWLRDPAEIAKLFEDLARLEFARHRDPHSCALFYVALKKERLLSTLFRGAGHSRVADLLGRDFTIERNQEVAAKNAFALLGKHRYSLAAAFFLVGGHIRDGLGVCAREMGDPQLAIMVAALVDAPNGILKRQLVEWELFSEAVRFGDRGAQALLLWGIGKKPEALLALADVPPSSQGLSLSQNTVASEVSLLQFALVQGLPSLAGRYIPVSLLKKLQGQATVCAHILGVYGLPLLALQVLRATSGLTDVAKNSGGALGSMLKDWELRLLTDVMVRRLPAPQAVSAREPYLIAWHEHVKSDLGLLKEHGFVADSDAVIASLEGLMEALFEVPAHPIHKRSYSSQPNLAYTRDKPPISGSSSILPKGGHQLCQNPRELLHVDGDRCAGVCCSHEAEEHGPTPPHIHRVAVGTSRHGMHYVDWGPSTSTDVGEMRHTLQLHRWPKNRWLMSSMVRKMSAGSAVAPQELNTGPLVSHPCVGLFLSGGNTEAVNLWRFGESSPCANFIPAVARDSSTRGWESPKRMCWNASGDRLAAVGMDGSCATWQLDAGARTEAGGVAGCSELVVPRRGGDIKFVDGSGSILAVSGEDEHGHGSIRLWDTLSPLGAGRIVQEFEGAVTQLAMIPSTQILVSAFNSGAVAAHDLRMLRDGPATPLWSLPAHNGPITSMMVGWGPFGGYEKWDLVLATGGKDGDVCVVDQLLETGRMRQRIQKVHWKKSGQLSGLIMSGLKGNLGISASSRTSNRVKPSNAVGAAVLDLEWCDEGLVSSGADGVVLLFPWESTGSEPN